ncbi:transposase [Azotobacter chroococcum]|nr:transposase [Azotobacter chroococcum]
MNPRSCLSCYLTLLCSGANWRDLSERYGPWKTVNQRFRQWRDDGAFEQALRHLHLRLREDSFIDLDTGMVDSTSIPGHQSRQRCWKKGARKSRSTNVSTEAAVDYIARAS